MKIPEEIQKSIKWEHYPKHDYPLGGQTTGQICCGFKLICEDVDFEVAVNYSRSMIKNKQLCLDLFELYLMEIKVI